MITRPAERSMPDTLLTRARAFEFRHRALLDAIAAAVVGLVAIAFWYAAFALFND